MIPGIFRIQIIHLLRTSNPVSILAVLFGFTAASFNLNLSAEAKSLNIDIKIKSIPHFQVGVSTRTKFGALRYSSGIEYYSDEDKLGGISGIRVLDGGRKFLTISDQGNWFSGTIDRDESGRIIGLSNARIAPILNRKGKIITSKRKGDAEGIEIIGDRVLVSFERKSRILSYKLDLEHHGSKANSYRKSIKKIKLPNNNGLEAITILERDENSTIGNARIAVFSEHSLDRNGNIRGFVSKSKKWKTFSVQAIGEFKITDAALLPSQEILILERQFSITSGATIRIRKIPVSDIKPGALVDGDIIFEADGRYEIDNLEGLSIWQNSLGQTMLTLVSDDNFSFLQRSLMLEFELPATP